MLQKKHFKNRYHNSKKTLLKNDISACACFNILLQEFQYVGVLMVVNRLWFSLALILLNK